MFKITALVVCLGIAASANSASYNRGQNLAATEAELDSKTFEQINNDLQGTPEEIEYWRLQLTNFLNAPNTYTETGTNGPDCCYFDMRRMNYLLYKQNDVQPIKSVFGTPLPEDFKPSYPTKVIIHGWLEDGELQSELLARAYQKSKRNVNILVVDWGYYSKCTFFRQIDAVIKKMGEFIAEGLLNEIVKRGSNPQEVQLIGKGMGAHVAGFAGRMMKQKNVVIGRITGLGPLGNIFDAINFPRLSKDDAEFVYTVNTNMMKNGTGTVYDLGHANFIINDGLSQPGTNGLVFASHERANHLWAEAAYTTEGFYGQRCDSYEDLQNGSCANNALIIMDDCTSIMARGRYFVRTSFHAPYALGPDNEY